MAPRPDSPKPAKTESKDSIETPIEQAVEERRQEQTGTKGKGGEQKEKTEQWEQGQAGSAAPPAPRPETVTASAQRSDDPTTGRLADNGMAGEEEVRKFFESYVKRYTLMDIHGFLTFFSSRAIQNRTDDIERDQKGLHPVF